MRRMKMMKKTYRRIFQCFEDVFYAHPTSIVAICRSVFALNCEMGGGPTLLSSEREHVTFPHLDARAPVRSPLLIDVACEHARQNLDGLIVHGKTNIRIV